MVWFFVLGVWFGCWLRQEKSVKVIKSQITSNLPAPFPYLIKSSQPIKNNQGLKRKREKNESA
jgi:hypothetical protein